MKKIKRFLAGLGAILLILMYCATLIFALIDHPSASGWFQASLVCTVIFPVLLYGYLLVYKLTNKNDENKQREE